RPRLVHPRELPRRGFGTAEGRAAFLHAIAHIEFNAIDLGWDAVYRFRGMPAAFYADWVSVADDEARHFALLRARLRDLGHDYGDFDAHNGLWEMAEKTAHDALARMALVPRVLEARGLDVTPGMIARLRGPDDATADLLEVILAEEVAHVAAGRRRNRASASSWPSTRARCCTARSTSMRAAPPASATTNWPRCSSWPARRAAGGPQAASDSRRMPAASTRSTEPCSYQSPSTTRVRTLPSTSSACPAGRWGCPWIIRSTSWARKAASTAAGVTSVMVSMRPDSRSSPWRAWLAARAWRANARRASSGCARNACCQAGSRVCARNCW